VKNSDAIPALGHIGCKNDRQSMRTRAKGKPKGTQATPKKTTEVQSTVLITFVKLKSQN
jgi:hypothetical protein